MTDAWVKSNVSAVLMAAGMSTRMGVGRDKLLLKHEGSTLLERAVMLMDSLDFRDKILVITPERLCLQSLPPNVTAVINEHPEAGQSHSLRLGLEAATGSYYLFLTADQPLLTALELRRLLETAAKNPDRIVYPAIGGFPTSPSLFPSRFRGYLLELSGDTGGRRVREAHPEACLAVDFENTRAFLDVDSWEDYEKLTKIYQK